MRPGGVNIQLLTLNLASTRLINMMATVGKRQISHHYRVALVSERTWLASTVGRCRHQIVDDSGERIRANHAVIPERWL